MSNILEQIWILVFCCVSLSAIFVECSVTITTSLRFTENGHVKNARDMPTCGAGERIRLLSYSYTHKECRDDCVQMVRQNLSTETITRLHNACSSKEACTNITLPSHDEIGPEKKILNLTYRCEDNNTLLVNPCDVVTAMYYNTSFQLQVKDPLNLYNDCQCFIKEGEFRIYAIDIRLRSPDGDTCSLAKLQVNSHTYKCDEENSTFSSAFNTEIGGLLPRGFISLTKPRLNGQFQMTWLGVQPHGRVSISCARSTWVENFNAENTTSPQVKSTTVVPPLRQHPYPNVSSSLNSNDKSGLVQTIIIGGCAGGGVIALAVTATLIVLIRRRCRQNEPKDDYIQPVYKGNCTTEHQGQHDHTSASSKFEMGACGTSVSSGTARSKMLVGSDKLSCQKGDDPYYLELRESSGSLIYESIQETHGVYEQIKNDRQDRGPGYADLKSIKYDSRGYCVPFASQREPPTNDDKTEARKDATRTVDCSADGYCVPFTNSHELPENVNKNEHLKADQEIDKTNTESDDYLIPMERKRKDNNISH